MFQGLKPQIRYNSNLKHLQYNRRIPQIPGRISAFTITKSAIEKQQKGRLYFMVMRQESLHI